MNGFQPEGFRKPTEPRVPPPGPGGDKIMSPQEKAAETRRKNREAEDQKRKDQAIIDEAVKRFKRAADAEADFRAKALEDLKFKAGDQWPADIKSQRVQDQRPCLTINTIPTFTHQIENDIRENRPGINISPTGMNASKDSAELFSGMIRAIERNSSAEIAQDTAVISAIDIGFGYFRVLTEHESDKTFDQVIVVKRIRNPFTVLLDYERQEPDGCDAKWGFVSEMVQRDDFKEKWPKAYVASWNEQSVGQDLKHWITRDQVRVAEYFEVTHEMRKLVMLSNGVVTYEDELDPTVKEAIDAGKIEVEQSRDAEVQKVMWYRLTAYEILERQEWLGKWIPIIEVIGDEIDIEGRIDRFGVIRNAKDPARMKNYWSTAKTEFVALQPKAPYMGAEGSFDGHENEWKVANVRSFPYLEYVPVMLENGQYAPPPQRQPAPQVPQGYVEAEQNAQQDMMRTTGIRFDSSLGERTYDESGKALHQLRGITDLGSAHYGDNLKRSLRHYGRILVDLIPKVYNRARMESIVNEDGTDTLIKIDPNAPRAVGKIQNPNGPNQPNVKVFNPRMGEYQVAVTTGPNYATRRIEAQEQITKLAQTLPQVAAALAPLIAKYSDWPGANEAYKLLMALLPQAAQMTQASELPPAVQALVAGLQGQLAQLMAERQKMLKDLTDQQQDRLIRADEARTKRVKVDRDFEARMAAVFAKAAKDTRDFHSAELDRLLQAIQAAEVANPAGGGSPARGNDGVPQLAAGTNFGTVQ